MLGQSMKSVDLELEDQNTRFPIKIAPSVPATRYHLGVLLRHMIRQYLGTHGRGDPAGGQIVFQADRDAMMWTPVTAAGYGGFRFAGLFMKNGDKPAEMRPINYFRCLSGLATRTASQPRHMLKSWGSKIPAGPIGDGNGFQRSTGQRRI